MHKDLLFIVIAWIITIILLVKFIPRYKIREAILAFIFKQTITWLLGLIVVEMNLIKYPVREFPHANMTSFSFEFLIYPAICAIFIINFPNTTSKFKSFMYYMAFCSPMTFLEVIVEKYTNIIKYIHWNWIITWSSFMITFYFAKLFYVWFYKAYKKV